MDVLFLDQYHQLLAKTLDVTPVTKLNFNQSYLTLYLARHCQKKGT
jgi:hypothetical protein